MYWEECAQKLVRIVHNTQVNCKNYNSVKNYLNLLIKSDYLRKNYTKGEIELIKEYVIDDLSKGFNKTRTDLKKNITNLKDRHAYYKHIKSLLKYLR